MARDTLLEELLTLERAGLDLWARGDTPGYAARLADHATYFDHVTRARLEGRPSIMEHVTGFQGEIDIPRHAIIDPVLHHDGNLAVLAFNWDPYDTEGDLMVRWNATSVYHRIQGTWTIVHTHWSMVPKG